MDFFLSDKHRVVRRSVRTFCERELNPIAKDIDQEASFPWDVVEKMGRMGYFGIQVPKNLGGAGMDAVRLNFSHGDHASHDALIESVRKLARDRCKPIPIIQDLQGPRFRVLN